ncbi:uncharacterized protein C2845_PM08G10290 [Panicum miliaceum]|uniref:Uncharacterized protein n=1 Tax=Panicum miliaceum TaxID=4540 RepID=A0A3L6R2Z8_PANMI|nr:uncharacterized protein C2845_PM08G10290 [Panicum miliaceum]
MVAIASPSAPPASASTSSGLDERAPHERTACPSTSTPSSRRGGHGRVRLRADGRRGPVHDPPGSEPLPAAESSLFHDHPTPPVGASLPVYVSDGTRRWAINQQGARPGSVGGRPEAGNDAFPGSGIGPGARGTRNGRRRDVIGTARSEEVGVRRLTEGEWIDKMPTWSYDDDGRSSNRRTRPGRVQHLLGAP